MGSSDNLSGSLAALRAAFGSAPYTLKCSSDIVLLLLPPTRHYGEGRSNIAWDLILAPSKVITSGLNRAACAERPPNGRDRHLEVS